MIPGALAAAKVAAEAPKLEKLKKACDGLEASFLKQMLTAMHHTVQETDQGGDHTGMDEYKGMMDNALADRLAERGTLGISKMVYRLEATRTLNDALGGNRPR